MHAIPKIIIQSENVKKRDKRKKKIELNFFIRLTNNFAAVKSTKPWNRRDKGDKEGMNTTTHTRRFTFAYSEWVQIKRTKDINLYLICNILARGKGCLKWNTLFKMLERNLPINSFFCFVATVECRPIHAQRRGKTSSNFRFCFFSVCFVFFLLFLAFTLNPMSYSIESVELQREKKEEIIQMLRNGWNDGKM